jgi:hypothetical protein
MIPVSFYFSINRLAMGYLLAAILFFLVITAVRSQPNPRHLEEIAYDAAGSKLLVFGGIELANQKWIEPTSLHEWDGNKWKVIETAGPVGRRGAGWVYDETSKETFLFGGVTTGKVQPDSVLMDAWKWNGSRWKMLNTTCPVKEPEATFDPVNKRVLVYGDAANKNLINYDLPASFELWEFKNGEWRKLSDGGPNITGSRMISFDASRNKLVVPVFEDNKLSVWEWSDGKWTKSNFEKDCPGYRTRFAMAYHPVEKVTLLFGGLSADRRQQGDLWKWDGRQWKKIDFRDGPSIRNSSHFVFSKDQLILYGGSVPRALPATGIELSNEMWGWKNDKWKLLK